MLLGTAALHPSMRLLSEPGPEPDTRLTRARLALLACASLTVPLVIVVREALHEQVDIYVLIGASGAMFALVLMRLAGIVRRNEEATKREAALRLAGETLVSAATRGEIYDGRAEGGACRRRTARHRLPLPRRRRGRSAQRRALLRRASSPRSRAWTPPRSPRSSATDA